MFKLGFDESALGSVSDRKRILSIASEAGLDVDERQNNRIGECKSKYFTINRMWICLVNFSTV